MSAGEVAVIMFGTNDIGWWADDHFTMSWIIEHLFEIVDQCIAVAGQAPQGCIDHRPAPLVRIFPAEGLTFSL